MFRSGGSTWGILTELQKVENRNTEEIIAIQISPFLGQTRPGERLMFRAEQDRWAGPESLSGPARLASSGQCHLT